MPITAADIQKRILERTGDFDPITGDPVMGGGGYLEQQMANVWAEYADKAYVGPRLQELCVERDLLRRTLPMYRNRFDFTDGVSSFKRSQWYANAAAELERVMGEIDDLAAMLAANRAGAVGQLTTTSSFPPPFSGQGVDANSPRYSGNPYFRKPWNYP